jgi:hypothetical protein
MKTIIITNNYSSFSITQINVSKKEKPYEVKLARITSKWVGGKYVTDIETVGGGMSNSPMLKDWCKRLNNGVVKQEGVSVSYLILTEEMIQKMQTA